MGNWSEKASGLSSGRGVSGPGLGGAPFGLRGRAAAPGGGGGGLGGRAFHSENQWTAGTIGWQIGWRFTVGANDIDVAALMIHSPTAITETVRLWRVSDSTLITSADVTSGVDEWGETEITPITLTSGSDYLITRRMADGSSRTYNQNPSRSVSGSTLQEIYDSAITYVENRYVGGDGFPTSTLGTQIMVNFRTPAPDTGYRFLRFHVTAVDGGTQIRVDELEYRSSVGGLDLTASGGGWADSNYIGSFPGASAFSNSTSAWISDSGVTDASVFHDAGTRKEFALAEYTVRAGNSASQMATAWTVEGSNDLVTWDVLHTVTGQTGWVTGEVRTFTL